MESAHDSPPDHPLNPGRHLRRQLDELLRQMERFRQGHVSRGALHDLRIGCRRCEAMLRLCEAATHSPAARWLRHEVRALRRSTSAGRDDDVLKSWLERQGAISRDARRMLKRRRKRHVKTIVAKIDRLLKKPRLFSKLRRATSDVRCWSDPVKAFRGLGRGLLSEWMHFIASIPTQFGNPDDLHAMRIAGKRLRYALENVVDIRTTPDFGDLLDLLQTMQKRLGKIQDAATREHQLKSLGLASVTDDVASEPSTEVSSTMDFADWWQSQALHPILGSSGSTILSMVFASQANPKSP